MIGLRFRRRRERPLDPRDLRHGRTYRVEARIPHSDLGGAVADFQKIRWLEWHLQGLVVEWDPPAAGPEASLVFSVPATCREQAERYAPRHLARLGLTVLAVKVRP